MKVQMLRAQLIGERWDIPRVRPVDKAKARDLAASIQEIGLLSPLIVRPGTRVRNGTKVPGWDILSGRHRFEAMFRILNWDEIPCVVMESDDLKSELVTIDENLVRRELSDAERAYQTARRKELYEALHPETRSVTIRGGPGRGKNDGQSGRRFEDLASGQSGQLPKSTFAAATARSTGRSERSVRRDASRGEALGPTLNRIIGTSLDKQVEIDALAALPQHERDEIVARAEKGERVSARKPSETKTVVQLDTEELQANTVGRRLMREYIDAPRKAQHVFDGLYASAREGAAKEDAG